MVSHSQTVMAATSTLGNSFVAQVMLTHDLTYPHLSFTGRLPCLLLRNHLPINPLLLPPTNEEKFQFNQVFLVALHCKNEQNAGCDDDRR